MCRIDIGLVASGLIAVAFVGFARGADEPSLTRQVGTAAAEFGLKDVTSGLDLSLKSLHGKKAVVLVFLGIDCPVGNQYVPRLVEIAKEYDSKGVALIGINSNTHETAEQVAKHVKEYNISFPVAKDEGSALANKLQVARTCECVVLDEAGVIRYRGAIDDQYGYGTRKPRTVKPYLTATLDSLIAGKTLDTSGTSVVGCPIDKPDRKSTALNIPKVRAATSVIREALKDEPEVKVGDVTFSGDVAAILQNRCQNCHRPKAAAPFSLLSYDDARRWAASIREVVDDRRMPPWHADPRYGHFENDRRLTPKERATLVSWVDQGTPLGDPKEMPAAKLFPEAWAVGTPDVVYEMPAAYTVPAEGVVRYEYFKIPLNFKEDRWLQSVECLPGDRSVVHHIIAYLDDGKPGRRGEPDHLGGYAPGELPSVYNPGIGKFVPAGSSILLQVHYTPNGKIRTDRSRVGIIFAKETPKYEAITHGIANNRFKIPAGDGSYEVKSRFKFNSDSHLLSFMPHMHLRGKDFRYTVTYPGKEPEVLLSVPAYDFAWQSYYRLEKPLPMPKGTIIDCVAHFDNSDKNLANPNPKAEVRWGDQTFEEMMIGYIDYYKDEPVAAKPEPKKVASNRKP